MGILSILLWYSVSIKMKKVSVIFAFIFILSSVSPQNQQSDQDDEYDFDNEQYKDNEDENELPPKGHMEPLGWFWTKFTMLYEYKPKSLRFTTIFFELVRCMFQNLLTIYLRQSIINKNFIKNCYIFSLTTKDSIECI